MAHVAAACYRTSSLWTVEVSNPAGESCKPTDDVKKKKEKKKPKEAPKQVSRASSNGPTCTAATGGIPQPLPCPSGAPRPVHGTDKLYMDDTQCFFYEGASLIKVATPESAEMATLVLDKTIFHPQGGGQPTDKGTVKLKEKKGEPAVEVFRVVMVKEDRATGIVNHHGFFSEGWSQAALLAKAGGGSALLVLEIDGPWRVSCARIHSAGHALDVAMLALGYHSIRPTKGYHFPEGPYVEYEAQSADQRLSSEEKDSLPGRLTAQMAEIAAAAAGERREVAIRYLSKSEATSLCPDADLSMFEGEGALVRVARIAGCWIPCGGTHVASLEEIGPVTVTRAKAKKNALKVSYELQGMVF